MEEEESGWSSGEFSNEEDNGQDSTSPGFEVGCIFLGSSCASSSVNKQQVCWGSRTLVTLGLLRVESV